MKHGPKETKAEIYRLQEAIIFLLFCSVGFWGFVVVVAFQF